MRKTVLYLFCLLSAGLVQETSGGNLLPDPPGPRVVEGVLDLTEWDFEKQGVIKLHGDYGFYWKKHLLPQEISSTSRLVPEAFVPVPEIWSNLKIGNTTLPGEGFATYHCAIILKKPRPLAFEFRDAATNCLVFANGKQLFAAGFPGQTRETAIPGYRTGIAEIVPEGDRIDLVIHVSNFHYKRGGLWKAPVLGLKSQMERRRENRRFVLMLLFFSILTIGGYHLGHSVLRSFHRESLYFGLFCILIAIWSITQEEVYLMTLVPSIPWEVLIKIEYLTYFLAVPLFCMFLNVFFIKEFWGPLLRVILGLFTGASVFVLCTPAHLFSHVFPLFHLLTLVSCAYGLFVLVKSVVHKRDGAVNFLIGYCFLFATIAADILSNLGLIHTPSVIPAGVMVFIFFLTIIVASRFTTAYTAVETQRSQLAAVNNKLLDEISERKRAEEENRQLQEKLSRSQKMEAIGLLAGGVAHDLNNMLVGVATLPEVLLLDMADNNPLKRPLEEIRNAGFRAGVVVQDLLTLSRRNVLRFEPVNIDALIAACLVFPEHKKIAADHPGLRIETIVEKGILPIMGSPVHLQKVLLNLVLNSAEAKSDGCIITIRAANRINPAPYAGFEVVPAGSYVVLSVSDTGSGIAPQDLNRVFEPFYTKKKLGRSGTGLGMTVVWGTVHDHKGFIDIKSEINKGTSIDLYFPVAGPYLEQAKKPATKDLLGHGETVLVVDDVAGQRAVAVKALEALGYRAQSASSGEEAEEMFRKEPADLVVLDMIMDPGISGLETYQRLLKIDPCLKAIMASGFAETDDVNEARKLGAGSFVRKPYTLNDLASAVKEELAKPR